MWQHPLRTMRRAACKLNTESILINRVTFIWLWTWTRGKSPRQQQQQRGKPDIKGSCKQRHRTSSWLLPTSQATTNWLTAAGWELRALTQLQSKLDKCDVRGDPSACSSAWRHRQRRPMADAWITNFDITSVTFWDGYFTYTIFGHFLSLFAAKSWKRHFCKFLGF